MFILCCQYLSTCSKQKTVGRKLGTSYGLKHCVEDWSGRCISNGAFISALIFMGFKYEQVLDSPNVLVGMKLPLPVRPHRQRHLMVAKKGPSGY